jgi:signal transduction histidine kinase
MTFVRNGSPSPHHTGIMLRAVWIARVSGLALVGVLTFAGPPAATGARATQTVVYIIACLGWTGWAVSELRQDLPERTARRLLIGCLGAITVASCFGAAAGGAGDAQIALAVSAMMSAGSESETAATIGIGALGLLAVETGAIVFGQGLGTLLGFPLLLVVGTLVGRNRASYRVQAEQAAALLAQHERLRAEQRRADVLDERARIAREIHDVLAHSLGALGIQIQTARAYFADLGDTERGLEALATAQRMAADGLTETRRAVLALRTDTLPLHEELARAAAEHAATHRVTVDCETEGAQRRVPPDATVALLRTATESLVNAAKHARGQAVRIRLGYAPDEVLMTVVNALSLSETGERGAAGAAHVDAPAGFHTVDGGYGLTGMRERLRLLRGTLEAGARGGEWIVTARIPLAAVALPGPDPATTSNSVAAPGPAPTPEGSGR